MSLRLLLEQAVERAYKTRADYLAALERDYPYNLVTRNCVSEIFRELDVALARAAQSEDEAVIREESIRRLGGHVAARNLAAGRLDDPLPYAMPDHMLALGARR
jgi:hypothetical protein